MGPFKNLILDRDGTIIYDKHYLSHPQEVELLPRTGEALALFQRKGIKIYVVSNQSGIGRGYFTEKDLGRVNRQVEEELAHFGVSLRDMLYCPHTPSQGCECRKPSTGMWRRLVQLYGLRPEESIMVGDKESDITFGKNASLALTCLVLTGYGKEYVENTEADIIAHDLYHLFQILTKKKVF